jgi:hypothetical protein
VGILHACLERRAVYREAVAWPGPEDDTLTRAA